MLGLVLLVCGIVGLVLGRFAYALLSHALGW
jgi:hypothetical protein